MEGPDRAPKSFMPLRPKELVWGLGGKSLIHSLISQTYIHTINVSQLTGLSQSILYLLVYVFVLLTAWLQELDGCIRAPQAADFAIFSLWCKYFVCLSRHMLFQFLFVSPVSISETVSRNKARPMRNMQVLFGSRYSIPESWLHLRKTL